jgi:hypothetical protein
MNSTIKSQLEGEKTKRDPTGSLAQKGAYYTLLLEDPHEALGDGVRAGCLGLNLILEVFERPNDGPTNRGSNATCAQASDQKA